MTGSAKPVLRDTKWLAALLGVSVSFIEKRRSSAPETLPPHIKFGRIVRYDEGAVLAWLAAHWVGDKNLAA